MGESESPATSIAERNVKMLAWILLAFAAVFAAGAFAWQAVVGRGGDVIQVHARHILVKVPDDPNDKDWEQAKSRIEAIREELDSGAAFENLARRHSDCPSKSRGGDLDWFGRGGMVKEFEEACWSAEAGEVIGPVKTKFGYHLIEVLGKR